MKKTFLFPTYFKTIGWIILLASVISVILCATVLPDMSEYNIRFPAIIGGDRDASIFDSTNKPSSPWFQMADANYLTTLLPAFLMIGLCFVAFARQKVEDE